MPLNKEIYFLLSTVGADSNVMILLVYKEIEASTKIPVFT